MRIKRLAFSAMGVCLTASAAWGQACPGDISYATSGAGTPGTFSCWSAPGGLYDIEIIGTSTGTLIYTVEIENGISIRELKIKNEGGSGTTIIVTLTTSGRVENVLKHPQTSGEVWIGTLEATAGIGTGSGGLIDVHKALSLATTGDITAEISISGSGLLGQTEAIGSILCDDLLHDIHAGGDVGAIQAGGSFISVGGSFIVGDLDSVTVIGDLAAALDITGQLRRVECGELGGSGPCQISAQRIGGTNSGVFVSGDWVSGAVQTSAGGLDGPIEIDGSFGTGTTFASLEVCNFGDLRSQVTINKANSGGVWGETARVCFIDEGTNEWCDESITSPYYMRTAEQLGYGSIGLAPFHLHDESCAPVNGGEFGPVSNSLEISGQCLDQCEPLGASGSITQALVRHYGPVQWASGDPLTVKRRSLACGGSETWTNVTSSFDFEIHTGSGDREIKVTYTGVGNPYWPIDFEYRIEPVAGVLKCKNVTGNPDVADYDYEFSLLADCAESFMAHYDQDQDEALTGLDIVAWSVDPEDLNDDSVADGDDLEMLMEAVQEFGN